MRTATRSVVVLVAVLAVTFAVAAFAAQFRPGAWYVALNKPSWTPPDAVFAPVWTTLYALMALAAWQVWRVARWARVPWALYGVQLMLNAAWSWLFFGRHQIGWAASEIVLLWLLIVLTTVAFWRHSRLAGTLLVPYAAWVGFAAMLNLSIWRLNA